jgi:hypothetical protein
MNVKFEQGFFIFMHGSTKANKQHKPVPGSCLDSPSDTIIDIIQKYLTEISSWNSQIIVHFAKNRNINHEKKNYMSKDE